MTLVEQFRRAVDEGISIGELSVLGRYQQLHRQDWQQTVQFSDSLIRIFGQPLAPVAAARNRPSARIDIDRLRPSLINCLS